jgi:hypothetical protein
VRWIGVFLEEDLVKTAIKYEEYIKKVRVPVVEINMEKRDFNSVKEEIDFHLHSFKMLKMNTSGFWKRDMF